MKILLKKKWGSYFFAYSLGKFCLHFAYVLGKFRLYFAYTLGKFRLYFAYALGKFHLYFAYVLGKKLYLCNTNQRHNRYDTQAINRQLDRVEQTRE